MTIRDWEYCHCQCQCHIHKDILHVMACCYTCEYCGRRITEFYYEQHIAECKKTRGKKVSKPSAFYARRTPFLR